MNNNAYLHIGNQSYYAYSLYYADSEWHTLLPRLYDCLNAENEVYQYYFFLSYERGAHIRLIISSQTSQPLLFQESLLLRFKTILQSFPSMNNPINYHGKELWMHHINNTILINTFKITNYTVLEEKVSKFTYYTSLLITELMDDDQSENSRISILLYLSVRLLQNIPDWINLIGKNEVSQHTTFIDEINIIHSYWKDNPDYIFQKENTTLQLWIDEVKMLSSYYDFNRLCLCISEIVGISELGYNYAIHLLNIWKTYYSTIKKELS